MDMKANFKSNDQKRYLLVTFGRGNVALYSKDNTHIDAYESWQNADDIEIEELRPREVTDKLTENNCDRHAESIGQIMQEWFDIKLAKRRYNALQD